MVVSLELLSISKHKFTNSNMSDMCPDAVSAGTRESEEMPMSKKTQHVHVQSSPSDIITSPIETHDI